MDYKTMLEVYNKLRGRIHFSGSNEQDKESLENFEEAKMFIFRAIDDIIDVHRNTDGRYESSAKEIHAKTTSFLLQLKEMIDEELEDL